jgi:hypothetical protein
MDIVSNKDSKKKNETLSPFIIIIIKDGKFHGKNIDPFIYPFVRLGANQAYIQFTSIANIT